LSPNQNAKNIGNFTTTVFSGVQGVTFRPRNSSVMCTVPYPKVSFIYKIECNMNWFKPCIPNCIAAKPAEIGLIACLHSMFCHVLSSMLQLPCVYQVSSNHVFHVYLVFTVGYPTMHHTAHTNFTLHMRSRYFRNPGKMTENLPPNKAYNCT
jgi:hypothetical protein